MGSAQTRNPLKRVDLNFEFIILNFMWQTIIHSTKADNFCEVVSSYFIYKQTAIKNSTHI